MVNKELIEVLKDIQFHGSWIRFRYWYEKFGLKDNEAEVFNLHIRKKKHKLTGR